MKKLFAAATLAAACLAAGAVTAAAQQPVPAPRQPGPAPSANVPTPPGPFGPAFGGPGFPGFAVGVFDPTRLLERRELLGLTADQVTRLSSLENDVKGARDKAQTDSKVHREELEKLFQQSTPDVAQVRTHAQALMQAQQGAQLATLTTAVQAKAVLTPEQRGRVQGWADGGVAMKMRRMGPGPGPGPERSGIRPLMRKRRGGFPQI